MMSYVGHSTDNTTDSVTKFSDYDNGQTLDKEKRISYLDSCNNELEENQKEGDMCMEVLLVINITHHKLTQFYSGSTCNTQKGTPLRIGSQSTRHMAQVNLNHELP